MKQKNKPKFIVLTDYDIAIGEFKNKRQLKNWLKNKKEYTKIISGNLKNDIYLPL